MGTTTYQKCRASVAVTLPVSCSCWWWILCMCGLVPPTHGQVNITTGSYFQGFGTTDITSWTNNVTFPGWYRSSGTFAGHENITSALPSNTGGFYTYECNGNNDQKIGSRASISASNIRYGVVFRNQTGFPIRSIRVSYTGYQLSLAQNGGAPNTISFDLVTSNSVPSITASATGSVSALNFSPLMSSPSGGSSQLQSYPCTHSTAITACFALATPLAVNSYILLRWTDIDDTNNDHHMAIDDVQVDFDITGTGCSLLLPITLLGFDAVPEGDRVNLEWATAMEKDNARFVVYRGSTPFALAPIVQRPGAGDSYQVRRYYDEDLAPLPGLSYYRLQQVDHDGGSTWSDVVVVQRGASPDEPHPYPNPSSDGRYTLMSDPEEAVELEVFDGRGRRIRHYAGSGGGIGIDLSDQPAGVYLLRYTAGADRSHSVRLVKADGGM
ncbi:MAG: T9SS type A sorting domain-containing protein [Flavobacteriales bacterium]|nr:MAG: T9SS type A sorting domain-containing protein [Flavobacteriales bacterium]